ncbi:Peptidase S8/S53 domain containing protein [Rhypophila sp. PSN 637]
MHVLTPFLALAYLARHGLSAAVLPRAHRPCPHVEPEGEAVDEYIVELHDHHSLEDHFHNIGTDLRVEGTDLFRYLEVLHAYRARLTPEIVHNTVRFDPGVRSVERGVVLKTSHTGGDAVYQDVLSDGQLSNTTAVEDEDHGVLSKRKVQWEKVSRVSGHHMQQLTAGEKITLDGKDHKVDMLAGAGRGVDIYILDSGINTIHKCFGGRASHFAQPYTHYTSQTKTARDEEGHGTHVAGIAGGYKFGAAQWANLVSVKVACKDPRFCVGHTTGLVEAINDVAKRHREKKKDRPAGWKGSVINLSLALETKSNALNRAIDRAYDAGIPIAVAAGNKMESQSTRATGTLCESQNTICVGGVEKNYDKGWFSRGGRHVDIWAPGEQILSAALGHPVATGLRTGTSMATPMVAGIMATIVGYESISDDARLVYDRVRANQLPNIVNKLKNPWFFGEKEQNFFAQTGIKTVLLRQIANQPYIGPGHDASDLIDHAVDPLGIYYKLKPRLLSLFRRRPQPQNDDNDEFKPRPLEPGYKNTEVTDPDPNDDTIGAVYSQEEITPLDTSAPEIQPFTDDMASFDADEPPEEQPLINGKPICNGNQVQVDCVGGALPPVSDYSGMQGPVCAKSGPRLNRDKLTMSATLYCRSLCLDDKVVLKEGGNTPQPAILAGEAENGGAMVLSVMYYKGSCPKDKSSSELDFGKMGVEKCVENLVGAVKQVCQQDRTWQGFNKDFEVLGGVWATGCGMFSVFGQ